MLEIDQLSFSYDQEKIVLDDVSFSLEQGKIYCLLGVNGAGKTTLFNCLSGFLKSNLSFDPDLLKDKLFYIQDDMHFYKNLTGIEFADLIFSLKEEQLDTEKFDQLVVELQMAEYKDERISTYSLGTKQKLVLMIGILLDYEYILMDEPFVAIDFITAETITNFLKEMKEANKTVVVSTHQLDIAQELADEILFLNNGQVYQIVNNFQTPHELKKYMRGYL